jgi:hypothetical protein
MKFRFKIGIAVIVLGVVFLWGKCSKIKPPQIVLPPNVTEEVTVNPGNHTLTVTTTTGSHTVILPDHVSVIDLGTDGKLTVKSPQYGLEMKPFLGWGYEGGGAVILGADLAYFKKLDLGVAAYGWTGRAKPAVSLSYTVWSNTRLTATYNGAPGLFVTVRF